MNRERKGRSARNDERGGWRCPGMSIFYSFLFSSTYEYLQLDYGQYRERKGMSAHERGVMIQLDNERLETCLRLEPQGMVYFFLYFFFLLLTNFYINGGSLF